MVLRRLLAWASASPDVVRVLPAWSTVMATESIVSVSRVSEAAIRSWSATRRSSRLRAAIAPPKRAAAMSPARITPVMPNASSSVPRRRGSMPSPFMGGWYACGLVARTGSRTRAATPAPTLACLPAMRRRWPPELARYHVDPARPPECRAWSAACQTRTGRRSHGNSREARPHHGNHGPGRLVPRRAAPRQGVRRPRAHPPLELLQHRPDRPPLPRPARDRPAPLAPPRGPHRLVFPHRPPPRGPARRGVQPGRPEPREGELRDARVHRGDRRDGHPPDAGGRAHGGLADPVLPGGILRDVREGAREPADGDNAVQPAQPVRRGEGLRPLPDHRLPRGLRHPRLQRHPVQPRVPAPWWHLRDPQGHHRDRGHPRGQGRARVPRQPRGEKGLGVRQGIRRGDVADAPAGCTGRLRGGDRRDALGPGAVRDRVRAGWPRLAGARPDRRALLPPDR